MVLVVAVLGAADEVLFELCVLSRDCCVEFHTVCVDFHGSYLLK